jgi:fatty acid desaturase
MTRGNGKSRIESGSGATRQLARIKRLEWPTVLLAVTIYVGWLVLTASAHRLPAWLVAVIGGWLIAWHGSLQHEIIHGHPSRSHAVNTLIGAVPLALWLPFVIYRRTHIAHHATPAITDPFDDPESRYLPHSRGILGRLSLCLETAQATLAGRLLLGPAIMVLRFLAQELQRLVRAPFSTLRDWVPHLIGVAAIAWWLDRCGIGLGTYALLIVYPGLSLTLLRSFAEHRAAALPDHRVATVERAGPFALLFLFNNLHAAHHRKPGLAWYKLPGYYRNRRAGFAQENGGLVYAGYGEIARRFLFRGHDSLIHPDHRPVNSQ